MNNAELALLRLPDDSPAATPLQTIISASEGSAALCDQMLTYAGRGALSTEPLDCNSLIREVSDLLTASLSKKVQLELQLYPLSLDVKVDKAQIHQVLLNLITNAAEAIGNDVGKIEIISDAVRLDEQTTEQLQLPGLAPGEYVRLRFRDNGSGMDAETQSKIFDPFYTTKSAGRGLGLAAVQGIVLGHHGMIALG